MRMKRLLFVLAALLVFQIGIILGILQQMKAPSIDWVAMNEIIHEQGIEAALEVLEQPTESFSEAKMMIALVLILSATIEILLLAGYLIYIQKTVFHPFRSLKRFAGRVAGGDLDIPLPMDKHNAFGAFTESFDLMREALKTSREQEAEANKSKKELIAKLSHDIKTPVASISAVAELMQVSNLDMDDKTLEQLSVIQSKADQINRLVSDLFHATLEELNQLTVTPTEQNSNVLCDILVAADYQKKADLNDIPPCCLVFDVQRLQQVFDNIFSNAYKYGGEHMEVKCSLNENCFVINVYDDGSGVDDEELPLIHEKFYRGKNANSKHGAGLGLYISRYLLTEMGGSMHCQNTNGGFCVTISLKLAGNFEN